MKKMMIAAIGAGALLLTAACGSDPNDDSHINGMSKSSAAVACQKYLANTTPGVSLSDFSAVSSNGIQKINVEGEDHWHIRSELDGRAYTCNVFPVDEDTSEVEGAFAGA